VTTTVAITPDDLHAVVAARLDAWDQRIRIDVDVDGCRLQLADDTPHGGPTRMYVEYVAVPKRLRRGGYGSAVMSALTSWADRRGVVLRLGISTEYGMSRRTLTRFYRRHGLVADRGPGQMVRHPLTTGQEK